MERWTDEDGPLVRAAQAGDRDALCALWERHRGWLSAVILQHKPASVELEDLLQDVATQLVGKLSTISEPSALVGWLKSTAVNTARWAGRRHEVRERHARAVVDVALARSARDSAGADAGAGIAARGGTAGAAERAVVTSDGAERTALQVLELARGLPAEYAEPLLLRAVQGLSYRQIGTIMGLPESTVETRIARGRRMLREAALRGSVQGVEVRGEATCAARGAGAVGISGAGAGRA